MHHPSLLERISNNKTASKGEALGEAVFLEAVFSLAMIGTTSFSALFFDGVGAGDSLVGFSFWLLVR